jgi:hypothetical protein
MPWKDVDVAWLAQVSRLEGVIADVRRDNDGSRALAAAILGAGYRYIDPHEKHVIEIRGFGWTIAHPLSCRLGGIDRLFSCEVNRLAEGGLDVPPRLADGRYEIDVREGHLAIGPQTEG